MRRSIETPSFRDGPKDQTRNLEIPGSMLRIAPERRLVGEAVSETHELLRLYSGEPEGWSDLHRCDQRSRASGLRASNKSRAQLHIQIQYHTISLVRSLRRSSLRDFPRERAEEVEAKLEDPINRSSEPAVERFVRVDLQMRSSFR